MADEFPDLTEEMFDAARTTLTPEARPRRPHFSHLTPDTVRKWSYAIGDVNPLWLDDDYATNTRWGQCLVPPTFPETAGRGVIFDPLKVPRLTPAQLEAEKAAQRRKADEGQRSAGTGFPGLAGLQVGRQFFFDRPVRVGERLRATQRVVAIVDSEGRRDGDCIRDDVDVDNAMRASHSSCADSSARIALQTFEICVYSEDHGDRVMTTIMHMGRFARPIPLEKSKYRDVPLPNYSAEELQSVVDQHRTEDLRGADELRVSDVAVGDELPRIVKGPHTPSDYMLYPAAFGSFFDVADRPKYLLLDRFPGAGIVDPATNVTDWPQMMHLDSHMCFTMGYPRGFDGSMQRISWFGHLVTNWMGDDARLLELSVFHLQPFFLFDILWLEGHVTSTDPQTRRVTLELSGVNHRGDKISYGTAQVQLGASPTA